MNHTTIYAHVLWNLVVLSYSEQNVKKFGVCKIKYLHDSNMLRINLHIFIKSNDFHYEMIFLVLNNIILIIQQGLCYQYFDFILGKYFLQLTDI